MTDSCPAESVAGLPDTGASRNSRPFAFARAAIARLSSGAIVLRSAHTAPGRRTASSSSAIDSSPEASVSIVKRTSAPAAAAPGLSATTSPASPSISARALVRFQPVTA